MRKRMLGVVAVLVGAVSGAHAADPKAATGTESKTTGTEIKGWAQPSPADLAVLEQLEGENLAEARKAKGTKLEIESARKDLDGDGIPELFFFVKHPMFCYDAAGCTILVIRRASLSDPFREIGLLTAPAPGVVVMPSKGGDLPTLRALGAQSYSWDGGQYKPDPGGAAPTPASDDGRN